MVKNRKIDGKENKKDVDLNRALTVLSKQAKNLEITLPVHYHLAGEVLQKIKEMKNRVETWLGPQCTSAYQAWQTALNQKKAALAPVLELETGLKKKMSEYLILEDERRRMEMSLAQAMETEDGQFIPAPAVSAATSAERIGAANDLEITVVDINLFIHSIVNDRLNIDVNALFTVKVSTIKAFVKSTGMRSIPGLIISEKKTISVR